MAAYANSNLALFSASSSSAAGAATIRRVATVRCGPRDNRGPLLKGRILSTEAIQAIQALKRAYRSDPKSLPTHALRRLIKSDLTAALKELLRQDQCAIAAVVFSVIQSEYGADINAYSEMVVALARKGMTAEIDALVDRMEEEAPEGIVRGESRGLLRMVKPLIGAERKESTVRIYEMMKRSGMGSTWEVDEYLGRVLSKGLRRFGEGKLADEIDSELGRLYKGGIFVKS
ncbi:protein THYLAKOID ASSEMBLY 8, chloroplastic-like [Salvia splendens]|uniref:protein THYLAKOID ASSEMBLY 8, chloroplastic-like n=1 Tax=Salvia splendens TaxID=180675 RepID=UPI001C25C58B|nr:protein THYLAKOID ASSEMBLY 8, chloroplastic-like [Salvia splendens]